MTVLVFAVLGFSSSQRFMQRQPGIIADVYYLHKGQYPQVDDEKKILTNPKFFLDYYFKHGVLRSEPAYFNFLFYPTQDYDHGFLDYQGYPITAKDGYMLREFFALRLRSVLKLGLLDQPGLYQFALLSDDGDSGDRSRDGRSDGAISSNPISTQLRRHNDAVIQQQPSMPTQVALSDTVHASGHGTLLLKLSASSSSSSDDSNIVFTSRAMLALS